MGGDTGRGATGVGFGQALLLSPNDGGMLAEAGQRKGEDAVGNALPDEADFSHKRRQRTGILRGQKCEV